jgi:hypothetical protein
MAPLILGGAALPQLAEKVGVALDFGWRSAFSAAITGWFLVAGFSRCGHTAAQKDVSAVC